MPKPTLQQQYDTALAKYRDMLAQPPKDYRYFGPDTETWLEMCDSQKRVVQHLKTAIRLSPKEPGHATAATRR
jgi:hypothetical protein